MERKHLTNEARQKLIDRIDSGEPFVMISGDKTGHTYVAHTESWRDTFGLVEVLRIVLRQRYKRENKKRIENALKSQEADY